MQVIDIWNFLDTESINQSINASYRGAFAGQYQIILDNICQYCLILGNVEQYLIILDNICQYQSISKSVDCLSNDFIKICFSETFWSLKESINQSHEL